MKVLMVSRYFPSVHPKAERPTEFVERILVGMKKHTIRKNAKGHFKDGDMVSLRYWFDRPYRSKQIPFSEGVIGIEQVRIVFASNGISAFVNDERINHYDLARNDGLSMADFRDWFFPDRKFGEFRGDILHFTEARYSGSFAGMLAKRKGRLEACGTGGVR